MGKDTSGLIVLGLSIVMLLTGGVLAYKSHDRNNPEEGYQRKIADLEGKVAAQVKLVATNQARITELSKALGWSRETPVSHTFAVAKSMDEYLAWFKGRAELFPEWHTRLIANDRIDFGTMLPWSDFAKAEMGEFLTVEKAVRAFRSLEKYLTEQTEGTIKERDEARAEEDKYIGDRGLQAVKEKEIKERLSTQRKDNEGLMQRIRDQSTQKKSEIAGLDAAVQAKLEEIDELRIKNDQVVTQLKLELGNTKDRIEKFQQRAELARSSTEADGRVTHSLPEQNYAWVDLGSKHTLLVGTRFEVFGLDKGGKKVPKGEVEVLKVWEDQAQVSILKTIDSLRPIEGGDYIQNEVFDRSKTKVFAFAGRFVGKYSNEEAQKKIEEIGGKVVEDATLETSYVVVGQDYETHANYLKALDWGVIIIREKDLYELMGLH